MEGVPHGFKSDEMRGSCEISIPTDQKRVAYYFVLSPFLDVSI
jgi:hypothetical protein